MTVAELIAHLQTLNPDTRVVVDSMDGGYGRFDDLAVTDLIRLTPDASAPALGQYKRTEEGEEAYYLNRFPDEIT